MKSKPNWNETQERFIEWWKGDLHESPLVSLIVKRDTPTEPLEPEVASFLSNEASHIAGATAAKTEIEYGPGEHYFSDMPAVLTRFRNSMRMSNYALDSYPSLDLNFGPGSLALYMGCEPKFSPETVWFNPCVHDSWENYPLVYDKDNYWWKEHFRVLKEAQDSAKGEFLVNIPDIVENMDILAAMRNPEILCIDMLDEPDIIKKRLEELNDLFFQYYDAIYNLTKGADGSSSFTAFRIWGPGKTCKVQCDFNVLMSPDHFREFVCPTLSQQCEKLDNTIFHLDGPDAIRHAKALMEIPSLTGLQWTPGAGNPDGGDERWYPLYDKVFEAGKVLWVYFEDAPVDTLICKAKNLVNRYGVKGLYINVMPELNEKDGDIFIKAAAKGFK